MMEMGTEKKMRKRGNGNGKGSGVVISFCNYI
jgi:hypothetical protein